MEKKVTKKDVLVAIKALVPADAEFTVGDVVVTGEDVAAYADTTLAQLAAKAAKAKERATEKKAEGDALRDLVQGVLTNEYQTIADIAAQIDAEGVTPAKVTARLTQLVKIGFANKEQMKLDDGRKVMGYAVGSAPVVEVEDAE